MAGVPETAEHGGSATYVWVLTNSKAEHRTGQVQLIDAKQWFRPLRKNTGKKNYELSTEDIQRICDTFLAFEETPQSKIFPYEAFGYWKVKVERPLGLCSQLTRLRIDSLRYASADEDIRAALHDELGDDLFENQASVREALTLLVNNRGTEERADDEEDSEGTVKKGLSEKVKKKLLDMATWKRDAGLVDISTHLREKLGEQVFNDHNVFLEKVEDVVKRRNVKRSAADLKQIIAAVSWRDESAAPVIKKVHKLGKTKPNPLYGLYETKIEGKLCVVEFEPDSELRDFATSSRFPFWKKVALKPSSAAKCCPTRRMPGLSSPTRRSAMRSAPTSSHLNMRLKACSRRSRWVRRCKPCSMGQSQRFAFRVLCKAQFNNHLSRRHVKGSL